MQHTHITLAHGNGGRYMRELIENLFAKYLASDELDLQGDAAAIRLGSADCMITTDGFTVQPLEFPGGDIGSLSIHGSCNDLAVAGAIPRYISLNVFIEEGLPVEQLERLIRSMANAAKAVNVAVVAGDTKVLPRGEGGGLYLATTAVGEPYVKGLSIHHIRHGDAILVSGPVGDHGIAVMLAREAFGLKGDIQSDSAHVLGLTRLAMDFDQLRFMRDPTRGGLATVCAEIFRATGMGLRLLETQVPIRDAVHSVCDMLGYDPMYLACEGRVVAVIDSTQAEALLKAWQSRPEGKGAAIIGHMDKALDRVVVQTELGGERVLHELEDDPLPRIC